MVRLRLKQEIFLRQFTDVSKEQFEQINCLKTLTVCWTRSKTRGAVNYNFPHFRIKVAARDKPCSE